jgi:hypothetical protein
LNDYIVTAIQVVSVTVTAAVISGVGFGIFSGLGSVPTYFAGRLVSLVGVTIGAYLGRKIGRTPESRARHEILGRYVGVGVSVLTMFAFLYFVVFPLIDYIFYRLFPSKSTDSSLWTKIYDYLMNTATLPEIFSSAGTLTAMIAIFSRSYYLKRIPSSVKITVALYVILLSAADFRAAKTARNDLSRTTPSFNVNYEKTSREVVMMRSLERVILIRFVDSGEVAFVEWQSFERGWFNPTR